MSRSGDLRADPASSWWDLTGVLAAVARRRRIVGFDITELAPDYGPRAHAQVAAKLAYRTLGLALPD